MCKKNDNKIIWIDLDNSPHVPFFSPIIKELNTLGYTIILTARDCAQTCNLADLYTFNYKRIGKHYGKNKIFKIIGLVIRTIQLAFYINRKKACLSLCHGSRSQILSSKLLNIPSVVIMDYEFSNSYIHPTWMIIPEIIPKSSFPLKPENIFTYPGIKEDVYVPFFTPDPSILKELNVPENNIVITIRPPAVQAHYHNHESEILFKKIISTFSKKENISMIIVSRYEEQKQEIIKNHPLLQPFDQVSIGITSEQRNKIQKEIYDKVHKMYFFSEKSAPDFEGIPNTTEE